MKVPLKRKHASGNGDDESSPAKDICIASAPTNKTFAHLDDAVTTHEVRIPKHQAKRQKRNKVDSDNKLKCSHCNKKTGLASTYDCRCGKKFCSEHRYAELHNCCFDYKKQGRLELLRNNPIVRAEKLEKI
ncbi:AN1-type zinc finger protein 5-like [Varroa jacobsoni]|uniref:AN1-type domain-containing protein n=1 Tax=Varroa destructor TaxID=109461 RepID=A0A7M7JW15_VARDE|nr:AN1-type zinc finger protein 5-like [Varroa destructor]XP_022693695.1 AN1-type zinc finger protein 5-like [Varroa jacobsoni]